MTKRVLIVEDDPTVAHLIEQILGIEGFVTKAVSDGRNAVEALRAEPYDVLILDVMLPGMDGISLLKSIREEPGLSRVPVVMLTAKTDDETTWAGWRAGCDYYMTKPFDPDELLAILERLEAAGAR
jgi:DNA-binding response OmpR family regulator